MKENSKAPGNMHILYSVLLPTIWRKPAYGCDGQGCIYFWPDSVCIGMNSFLLGIYSERWEICSLHRDILKCDGAFIAVPRTLWVNELRTCAPRESAMKRQLTMISFSCHPFLLFPMTPEPDLWWSSEMFSVSCSNAAPTEDNTIENNTGHRLVEQQQYCLLFIHLMSFIYSALVL